MMTTNDTRMPAFHLSKRLAVAYLLTASMLCAGDGVDLATAHTDPSQSRSSLTNAPLHLQASVGTGIIATNCTSTNVLWLWIDVPTNASRSDLLAHADMQTTNQWQPPVGPNTLATSTPWRTTATVETGFFRAEHGGWPDGHGYDRRGVDGWFQDVGVEMDRDFDHGDSGISVGIGVGVGRACLREP